MTERVRTTYTHLLCDTDTVMKPLLAKAWQTPPTSLRDPWCAGCAAHFPRAGFVWKDTETTVGD